MWEFNVVVWLESTLTEAHSVAVHEEAEHACAVIVAELAGHPLRHRILKRHFI
jgi:hypothetical protein